ncbi:MAG: hypothetical protein IPG66_01050 [Hydrogenophilales bacterium]|nr:hypothetical protein [Hydrogenophilales bacterium]
MTLLFLRMHTAHWLEVVLLVTNATTKMIGNADHLSRQSENLNYRLARFQT